MSRTLLKYVIKYKGETYRGTAIEIAKELNIPSSYVYRAKQKGAFEGVVYIDSSQYYCIVVTDEMGNKYKYKNLTEAEIGTGYARKTLEKKLYRDVGMKGWKVEWVENLGGQV